MSLSTHETAIAVLPRNGTIRVVLAALAGNLSIAVVKFGAFALTGSTAMLTEGIHSLVDTADQGLLLVADRRAEAAADATHPFGYGMEAYFWSFIVALLIFAAGAVASVWEGALKVAHPAPIDRPWISLIVIAFAAVFEGLSFRVAFREYKTVVRGRDIRLWRYITLSKDPGVFATLLEDGAALTGLGIAAVGITAAWLLKLYWADGAASILIGLLLAAIALVLANETRSLIAGEAASTPIVEAATAAARNCPYVEVLQAVDSLHLGPRSILIAVSCRFRTGLSGDEVQHAGDDLGRRVMAADPRICRVYFRLSARAD